jgi:uncharacterized protein GlcG (DUF336 family)
MKRYQLFIITAILGAAATLPSAARAQNGNGNNGNNGNGNGNGNVCAGLPTYNQLTTALKASVNPTTPSVKNGGLEFNMWASIVALDGTVCAVTFSGKSYTDQWLGSRVISAQKANTANDFSLNSFALSTANLYSAVQPGGSLFGLQESNPVDTSAAYKGPASQFGQPNDPLAGQRVGGVNVFGGGLALYNHNKLKIGALGVSGDTSCADHNVAWRVRHALQLDYVPDGIAGKIPPSTPGNDRIIYDIVSGHSQSGFGHPTCGGQEDTIGKNIGSACTSASCS